MEDGNGISVIYIKEKKVLRRDVEQREIMCRTLLNNNNNFGRSKRKKKCTRYKDAAMDVNGRDRGKQWGGGGRYLSEQK